MERLRSDLELAIAALTRVPNGGLVVMTDSYMLAQRAEVTSLVLRYRLPLVSPYRAYAELGEGCCRTELRCSTIIGAPLFMPIHRDEQERLEFFGRYRGCCGHGWASGPA